MLRFFSALAVAVTLTSCVTKVVRDESYVKEKNHFEQYGPEYKFVTSGEIVPDGDKLAAALECDERFEQEWQPPEDEETLFYDEKQLAIDVAGTLIRLTLKMNAKERHMVSCMAENDMELSDENAERWWPTKFSKEEPDLHPQESGTL